MATIARLLQESETLNSDSALLDAQLLLAHVLGCSRTYLYTWPEREINKNNAERYRAFLKRRQQGEPVAYIIGEQEFWSLNLAVSPATLIPRADTELLVELVLELNLPDTASVLDLGTGSGAIALALASEKPLWQVVAVDSQPEALELARSNALRHGLDRVTMIASDWYENVSGQFDLIVSNPPYIDSEDPHLKRGDVRFEPVSALVAADNGLADIAVILRGAQAVLKPGGVLMVEHGYQQGEEVRTLFTHHQFSEVKTFRDLANLERVTAGIL